MYTVERSDAGWLDVTLSGKLEANEMEALLDTLVMGSVDMVDGGGMLIEIRDFHLPSFSAMKVELSRVPELIRFIQRIKQVAVMSDAGWVNLLSSLEGRLIPGLQLRSFRLDQRYQAQTWLGSDNISGT